MEPVEQPRQQQACAGLAAGRVQSARGPRGVALAQARCALGPLGAVDTGCALEDRAGLGLAGPPLQAPNGHGRFP